MNSVRKADASRRASRFFVSLKMQALEYRRRVVLLLLVLSLPVAFFMATYYTERTEPSPVAIEVPERTGTTEVRPPLRDTWPVNIGFMGIGWTIATAAFFSVAGSLSRDRRLILCGYKAWQILLARLGILIFMSVIVAFPATLIFSVLASSLHPLLTWIAAFVGGLIAAGVGLLLGALIPRQTEGMLLIILVFGAGMSLGQDAARYFFMYPAQQLLLVGRFAQDPWPYPYIGQSLLIAAVFVVLALVLWSWRIRLLR